jgi:hypothetical protein
MKLITSELEIKNKKNVIKYGLILLVTSLLIFILGTVVKPKIPRFFIGMMLLPFITFTMTWILMIISYQLQIISNSDFSRRFKNTSEIDELGNKNNTVLNVWFFAQILFGLLGHYFYFGWNVNNAKMENNDIFEIILISIIPTFLFIISSYFARLNRIENKLDLLLMEKEEIN